MERPSFAERVRPWLPALFWVAVIALESTEIFTSEKTGSWLFKIVTGIFGPVSRRELAIANAVLRKIGHFVGYAILSYFFFRGWRGRFVGQLLARGENLRAATRDVINAWRGRWAVYSVLMAVGVASLDELHQSILPGRTGTWHDVVLDGFGAVAAQLIFAAVSSQRRAVNIEEEQKVS